MSYQVAMLEAKAEYDAWLAREAQTKHMRGRPRVRALKPPKFCCHGHPLTKKNLYTEPKGGWRCRVCRKEQHSRCWRNRMREAA